MRRFLLLPAFLWLILPIALVLLVRLMGPPKSVTEPPGRLEIFGDPVLFTPDGDSYRFVTFGQHTGVTPLWALTTEVREQIEVTWSSGWVESASHGSFRFAPGFYQLSGRWTYNLFATRFGERPSDKKDWFLSTAELDKVRPLVVAELNRRFPSEKRGDRLDRLLTQGTAWSGWLCKENIAILLTWLSFVLALAAICSMFVRPMTKESSS
jgi:hypothetical protein